MPNIGFFFGLPHSTVKVMFIALGLCKMHRNDQSHNVISNGIEDFNAKYGFDNDYLETSMVRIMDQRTHYVKLGYHDENSRIIWEKHKKRIMI